MPVHDWTRVDDGIFHDFHVAWIGELRKTLNRGILPSGYYALAEQIAGSVGPDVVTLQGNGFAAEEPAAADSGSGGGTHTLVRTSPQTRFTIPLTIPDYVSRRRTLVIHHVSGDQVVALLEIVSPGNKASKHAFRTFVEKAVGVLARGYHLLLVDLLPPTAPGTRRVAQGVHAAIAGELGGPPFAPPAGQPLTVASYEAAAPGGNAYVDTLAVGDPLPKAPLFLEPGAHVRVPLEATYREAYSGVPLRWRRVLEGAVPPR
jgi:hypothetical protein